MPSATRIQSGECKDRPGESGRAAEQGACTPCPPNHNAVILERDCIMAPSIVSPSPSTYRVDVVRSDQGSDTFHVVHCSPVAKFDDPEHAAFLVDLLTKGDTH